jgi:hypothetical protein
MFACLKAGEERGGGKCGNCAPADITTPVHSGLVKGTCHFRRLGISDTGDW